MRFLAAATGACLLAVLAAGPASAARPTGRYLVTFDHGAPAQSASALSAVLARTGVVKAGRGVPELRIATVRGEGAALARLRRDPAVESVSVEWERDLRRMPNDPALSTPESTASNGVPAGTPIQWALAREGFPAAWEVTTGEGALVGVIDSGVDGASPELAGKVASSDALGSSTALFDSDGHGTHVSGLACAATNNGVGVAGAGWGCRLAVVKVAPTTFGGIRDEDIVDGIRVATERGAKAINMSFGGGATNAALRDAIDFAVNRGVVLVAAASNEDTGEQGAPAVELQPGDAPDLDAGRGLVVTAAEFDDTRAGTGSGSQISLAAYGFFDDGPLGPPGLISAYPRRATQREGLVPPLLGGCGCRRTIAGDSRYAYLQGTSMATPQVAALAALVADLNPFLTVRDKLTLIKETARGSRDWTPELGWGIIDAGAAVATARRIDRYPPSSRARAKRRVRGARRARVRLRWSGADRPGAPRLVPRGIKRYEVYMRRGGARYRRIRTSRSRSALLRLRPGSYRFYTRARDRAGNREAAPRRADVRVTVSRPSASAGR